MFKQLFNLAWSLAFDIIIWFFYRFFAIMSPRKIRSRKRSTPSSTQKEFDKKHLVLEPKKPRPRRRAPKQEPSSLTEISSDSRDEDPLMIPKTTVKNKRDNKKPRQRKRAVPKQVSLPVAEISSDSSDENPLIVTKTTVENKSYIKRPQQEKIAVPKPESLSVAEINLDKKNEDPLEITETAVNDESDKNPDKNIKNTLDFEFSSPTSDNEFRLPCLEELFGTDQSDNEVELGSSASASTSTMTSNAAEDDDGASVSNALANTNTTTEVKTTLDEAQTGEEAGTVNTQTLDEEQLLNQQLDYLICLESLDNRPDDVTLAGQFFWK